MKAFPWIVAVPVALGLCYAAAWIVVFEVGLLCYKTLSERLNSSDLSEVFTL